MSPDETPKKTTDKTLTPKNIILRSYQVGFGDCFLLIFQYPDETGKINAEKPIEKFALIDFGTTGLPNDLSDKEKELQMLRVAKNISKRCNKKLHLVVATHRHKDHISGFSTEGMKDSETNKSTGELIAECKPDYVIQPWTEKPELPENAKGNGKSLYEPNNLKAEYQQKESNADRNFAMMLNNMHNVSQVVVKEANRLGEDIRESSNGGGFVHPINEKIRKQLVVMGDNNIKNKSAVENLRAMGKNKYVNYGSDLEAIEKLFGIKAKVLGPPTIDQYSKVMKQRSRDDEEFWMLSASLLNYWKLQSATANLTEEQQDKNNRTPDNPFPNAKVYDKYAPSHTRWFIRRMRDVRAEQLLSIVRILDKSMNNTSVILLLMNGNKKLLFPGDAQIENWEYVLKHHREDAEEEEKRQELLELLKNTTLYKVGHHGSRNATPKSLWEKFLKKSQSNATEDEKKKSMRTVVSTMEGKHGHSEETKVPRKTLVDELNKHSQYRSTEDITKDFKADNHTPDEDKGLYFDIEL